MNPQAGGVVEAVNQAATDFNNQNYQMDVLCFDNENSDWLTKKRNYKVFAIGKGISKYCFKPSYIFWLLKYAKNYDVVIIDSLWQFHVAGSYVLHLLKIPYCIFTHGMLDPYFNKKKFKYIKKLPFWFLIERHAIAMASATIFTCQEESLLAATSFPCYRSHSSIATLGVEGNARSKEYLACAFLSEFPKLKRKRFAVFLSRINEKKGIDLLIEALGGVDELPDDFNLVIAGPDRENLQKKLMERCRVLGISERIHWVGMLHGDVKWGAYHAAEFFILPSHQENFGIVVAEALSTATPVLITNKVNIWREIDEVNAGLVEDDTIDGVKCLLKQWFRLSEIDIVNMNQNAMKCYQENFSVGSAVADLESILISVTKG